MAGENHTHTLKLIWIGVNHHFYSCHYFYKCMANLDNAISQFIFTRKSLPPVFEDMDLNLNNRIKVDTRKVYIMLHVAYFLFMCVIWIVGLLYCNKLIWPWHTHHGHISLITCCDNWIFDDEFNDSQQLMSLVSIAIFTNTSNYLNAGFCFINEKILFYNGWKRFLHNRLSTCKI